MFSCTGALQIDCRCKSEMNLCCSCLCTFLLFYLYVCTAGGLYNICIKSERSICSNFSPDAVIQNTMLYNTICCLSFFDLLDSGYPLVSSNSFIIDLLLLPQIEIDIYLLAVLCVFLKYETNISVFNLY